MRLLLTSAGIKNASIREAVIDLLGKPIAESSALCIPTAVYAKPGGTACASLTQHPEVPARSLGPMDRAVCFPGR
jgi:dipeptidase E